MQTSYFMGLPVWLAEALVMIGWLAVVALICWAIDRRQERRNYPQK